MGAMLSDNDLHLDLKGLKCPLPVLKARKAMSRLSSGARISIEATDPLATIDIPHFCKEAGHRLLSQEVEGELSRFVIEKG